MAARIFYVEDEVFLAKIIKESLESRGYEVCLVTDGAKALSQYAQYNADICVLDVMLPHVDGFTIAREIRNTDTKTPFIFITAKTLRDDIVQGYKTGADDYITKPFDSEILLYKVKAILNRGESNMNQTTNDIFQLGMFEFDYRGRQLVAETEGKKQSLSPNAFLPSSTQFTLRSFNSRYDFSTAPKFKSSSTNKMRFFISNSLTIKGYDKCATSSGFTAYRYGTSMGCNNGFYIT